MAEVNLKNVTKRFEKNLIAVDHVNLDVRDREFVVLVGPSGCGKSTTLRMIAGLEEVSEGDIFIDGRRVNDVPPKDRDIAMVFQNYALYPHMTVYDNMAFGLKLRKYPKEEIRKRVMEAAEILGLTNVLDRKPKALSGGQRQRVAVGRAIVRKPKAFLFDEPLSNLDAKLRVQMRTEIIKLHKRLESTMIYVTHDQVEAMTMGDRIVVMKDGKVQQVDSPLNLYNRPKNKFVAGFIGSPAMNFFTCTVRGNGGLVLDGEVFRFVLPKRLEANLASYAGKQVVFGIRPEDIHLPDEERSLREKGEMEAEVDVVEPMGSEMYVYLRAGENRFVARAVLESIPRLGDRLRLLVDLSKAHFFDPVTEERIGD
ncbi:MAG TPA: sn-glycerol-3-phosphate ABC transporter ATP-binding protein UgpC [Bacteroidetes bacterium]|nr:sn-glycerol-3-phosphate ABC transporter ATP-binding protein UgpC [Bacteroidota bacterium]